MQDNKNPLIADTATETVQNVTEAMTALMTLIAKDHSGLCRLMQPMLHALEHVADNREATDGRIESCGNCGLDL